MYIVYGFLNHPPILYIFKFCSNNSILNLENHAGIKNSILDMTNLYGSFSDALIEISYLFKDIEKFSKFKNIYNLDIYSLTNVFKKFSFSNKILKEIVK